MPHALTLVSLLLLSLPVQARESAAPPADAETLARRLGETTWGMEELFTGKVSEVTVTLRLEELDSDGNVKHTQERVDRVTVKDGQQHREILQARKDGQDATEALRKDLEERQRKGPVRTEFNSVNLPFAASTPSAVLYPTSTRPLPPMSRRPGVFCEFDPCWLSGEDHHERSDRRGAQAPALPHRRLLPLSRGGVRGAPLLHQGGHRRRREDGPHL
ncbi:MAG TPA: hypothetical protein VK458_19705 [Myxococcaceae bacterium]|nr:hypothetical protein [Myxococcaceae bacterium]